MKLAQTLLVLGGGSNAKQNHNPHYYETVIGTNVSNYQQPMIQQSCQNPLYFQQQPQICHPSVQQNQNYIINDRNNSQYIYTGYYGMPYHQQPFIKPSTKAKGWLVSLFIRKLQK
jgi:hypothetical protein